MSTKTLSAGRLLRSLGFIVLAAVHAPSMASDADAYLLDEGTARAIKVAIPRASSFRNAAHAERWLRESSRKMVRFVPKALRDPHERVNFLMTLHAEATAAKISPELALAIVDVESRFQRFAVSPVGALGYMQVMPFWIDEIGKEGDNLFNTRTNLRMGCQIIRTYLDREQGDYVRALARYNGSLGKPDYPYLVLTQMTDRWLAKIDQ